MEAFLEKLARTLNRSIDSLGKSLPGIILALVKLNLVAFFIWYAVELSREAYGIPVARHAGRLVLVSLILFIVFGGWAFVAVWNTEWTRPPYIPVRGPIWPFIVLVAIPIAIIVIVSRFGTYQFFQPLSHATAHQAGRFISWAVSGL
jgi:hypothetical protein